MSKLEQGEKLVFVEVEPIVTTRVSVNMPLETAQILLAVLIRVGGTPEGPRGNLEILRASLQKAGIQKSLPVITGNISLETRS